MLKIQKVFTEDVQIGMYISQLDRPWIETPFIFQGFIVKTPEEIKELRRHCSFVFTDLEKSQLPPERAAKAYVKPSGFKRLSSGIGKGFKSLIKLFFFPLFMFNNAKKRKLASTQYKLKSLKVELEPAKQSYEQANQQIVHAMEGLREGKKLDMPVVQGNVNQMVDSIMRNPDAMTWLNRMKSKDTYVYNHSVSSAVWATIFGRHLELPREDLQILGLGVMLMDVGKTKLPKALLAKTDAFTPEQRKMMQRHVAWSLEILQNMSGIPEQILEIAATHHERYDGTGYPNGLKGYQIPVYGRIAGIVDCYDAMTSQRQYGEATSPLNAMNKLTKLADTEFQSEMVEKFIQAIGIFPTGTLVELNNGAIGVVICQNEARRLRPRIMLILDNKKQPCREQTLIDLQNIPADKANKNALWIVKGLQAGAYGINPSEYFLPDAGKPSGKTAVA